MSRSDYVFGLLLFAVGAGVPAAAAWRVVSARLAWMATEARVVAWGVVTLLAIALTTLVPLLLGVLSRGSVVITALALGALSLRVVRVPGATEPALGRPSSKAAWLGAASLIGLSATVLVAMLVYTSSRAIEDIDSTAFALPTIYSWVNSGSLWDARDFVPGWAFGAYPNHGGLIYLSTVVPWHADFGLRLVNFAFLGLGAAAVYALATELGASRAVAAAAAALGPVVPAAIAPALHAQADPLEAAGIASGALFLVRHARTGRAGELWLAALGLGLAFGTKWYGPPQVAGILAVWCGVSLLAHRPGAIRHAVLVGAGTAAVGGVWLVRNLIEFGSPLFPAKAVLFDGPATTAAADVDFSLLDYANRPGVLADVVLPQAVNAWALTGAVLVAGVVAAGALAARRRDGRIVAVTLGAVAVTAAYVAMPYTAIGPDGDPLLARAGMRYAIPALLLCAAATAWLVSRAPAAISIGLGVVGALAILHSGSVIDEHIGGEVPVPLMTFAAAGVAILAAAALIVVARRRRLLPALLGILVLAAAAGGRVAEQDQLAGRFGAETTAFIRDRAPEGARIGVTGDAARERSLNAAAFGPRIDNDVRFIGPRKDGLQVRDTNAAAFEHRLAEADVDLLVVCEDYDGSPAREIGWSLRAGWTVASADERYTILKPPTGA